MRAGVIRIERDAETCGDLTVLLSESIVFDASGIEMIELTKAGEGKVRRPTRGEGVERPRDLETMVVAVGVDSVGEPRFPVGSEKGGIGIADSEPGAVHAMLPSQLEV